MGIVGLPNVGKSTFFNLLCDMHVPAENFPFCTIDPSVSKVPVPDERFDHLVSVYKPKSVVPAVLTVTDAGPGLGPPGSAPRGTGVGWQLLEALAGQLRAAVSTDSAPNGLRVESRWPLPVLAA